MSVALLLAAGDGLDERLGGDGHAAAGGGGDFLEACE
jgi:hypothetical protein